MAQLGARFHGMEEVIGSIPIRSTNYFKHLAPHPFREFASLSQIRRVSIDLLKRIENPAAKLGFLVLRFGLG